MLGYRAAGMKAASPPTHHPLPLPSPPLPPPSSPLLLPFTDHRAYIPEAVLPPWKRLCLAPSFRFKVGEGSSAARPTRGYRADNGFSGTLDEDPTEAIEEVPPTTMAELSQRVTDLVTTVNMLRRDRRYHLNTTMLVKTEARVSKEKMPPRRGTRTKTPTATATTPMTDAAIRELIAQGVANALAEQTIQRNTNLNRDGSQGSRSGIARPVMESVFHISNSAVENQAKFATCTFHVIALTWWNSYAKIVGHDVAYEIEIWNLKMKGTDLASYTQRFQELALLCGRMFPEVSDEVKKYMGGLPNMIQGNVMSTKPRPIEKAIEIVNNLIDQKLCTFAERQIENKRKQDDDSRKTTRTNNNQTRGRTLVGLTPLGLVRRGSMVDLYQNVPNETTIIMVRVHRSATSATRAIQNGTGCYECGAQGHFKREYPKLKNKNYGNQGGNDNDPAKVYLVGNVGINLDSNVIMGLTGYYRRFIEGFSNVAKLMTKLTQKKVAFEWGDKQEAAFQTLKDKLCSSPILALPQGAENFIVYCDASHKGLGVVLM
ncbi:putative reverse transcriptase domain-containing protein [Tanacetum coccineum]